MSKESYARGFCKAAEAAGVDPNELMKFAKQTPLFFNPEIGRYQRDPYWGPEIESGFSDVALKHVPPKSDIKVLGDAFKDGSGDFSSVKGMTSLRNVALNPSTNIVARLNSMTNRGKRFHTALTNAIDLATKPYVKMDPNSKLRAKDYADMLRRLTPQFEKKINEL